MLTVVERAIENGYKLPPIPNGSGEWEATESGLRESFDTYIDRDTIFFDPEFAKAFFGDYLVCSITGLTTDTCYDRMGCIATGESGSCETTMEAWQWHLMKMATEIKPDDRLNYLIRYLGNY